MKSSGNHFCYVIQVRVLVLLSQLACCSSSGEPSTLPRDHWNHCPTPAPPPPTPQRVQTMIILTQHCLSIQHSSGGGCGHVRVICTDLPSAQNQQARATSAPFWGAEGALKGVQHRCKPWEMFVFFSFGVGGGTHRRSQRTLHTICGNTASSSAPSRPAQDTE